MPLVDRHTNVQPSSYRVSLLKSENVRHDQEQRESPTVLPVQSTTELQIPGQIYHKAQTASIHSKPSSYLNWSDTLPPGSTAATGELSRARAGLGRNPPLKTLKQSDPIGLGHHGNSIPTEYGLLKYRKEFNNTDDVADLLPMKTRPKENQTTLIEEQENSYFDLSCSTRPQETRYSMTDPHIRSSPIHVPKSHPNKLSREQALLGTSEQLPHIQAEAKDTKNQRKGSNSVTPLSLTKLLKDCETACTTDGILGIPSTRPIQPLRRRIRFKDGMTLADEGHLSGAVEPAQRQDEAAYHYLSHHDGLWTSAILPDLDPDQFMTEQYDDQDDVVYLQDLTETYPTDLQQPMYVGENEEATDLDWEEVEKQVIRGQTKYSASALGRTSETPYSSYEGPTRSRVLAGEFSGFWRPNRLY
jgi:hypothetical protein